MINIESILSGALSGGIITVIWNIYNKRNEYDYDHKKYILKKRQDAYERIEGLLLRLQIRNIDSSDSKRFHNIFYDVKTHNSDVLAEFNSDLNDLMGNSIWLTDKLLERMTDVNHLINKCLLELPVEFDYVKNIQTGKEVMSEIENLRIALFHQYLTDIKNLKNINSFLRKKSLM